ncbi:MAG: hypothetical protein ABH834_06500 [Candidatus Altiarchaeota archaeon]
MDKRDLQTREDTLDLIAKKITHGPTGLALDVLDRVIDSLNADSELKKIFGEPVSGYFGIIAQINDLKVLDLQKIELNEEQKKRVVGILDRILEESLEGEDAGKYL